MVKGCLIIVRRYTDQIKFAAYKTVSFIIFFPYSSSSLLYHCIYGCIFCMLLFNFVNYVFLLSCIFCSVYSVSLCCSVYCLCVNVYCTVLLPAGVNPIAVNRNIISYHIISYHIISYPRTTKIPCKHLAELLPSRLSSLQLHFRQLHNATSGRPSNNLMELFVSSL